MENEVSPCAKALFIIHCNCSVHRDKLEFVGETTLSGATRQLPQRGSQEDHAAGGSLASPFKGRCPEGAERFVPLPHKSLFKGRTE